MCRSLPQMLVATILRMTPCGALRPSGIYSLGKSSVSTFMEAVLFGTGSERNLFFNVTDGVKGCRLVSALTLPRKVRWAENPDGSRPSRWVVSGPPTPHRTDTTRRSRDDPRLPSQGHGHPDPVATGRR